MINYLHYFLPNLLPTPENGTTVGECAEVMGGVDAVEGADEVNGADEVEGFEDVVDCGGEGESINLPVLNCLAGPPKG